MLLAPLLWNFFLYVWTSMLPKAPFSYCKKLKIKKLSHAISTTCWLIYSIVLSIQTFQNWIGDVTTQDNIDFKVENTEKKISPGPALPVRFFVQYNPLNKTPRLQAIRLNGREICNANTRRPADDGPTFERPTQRPNVPDDSISSNTRPPVFRPTEIRPTDIRPEDRPQTRPVQTRPNDVSPVYVRPVNSPSPTNM